MVLQVPSKEIELSYITTRLRKDIPIPLNPWRLIEVPGLIVLLGDDQPQLGATLSLRVGAFHVHLGLKGLNSQIKFQNKFQFSLLSSGFYDDLTLDCLTSYFISNLPIPNTSNSLELHDLVLKLTKSIQLPNWNNKLSSMVSFQKAVLILLLSVLSTVPLLVHSSIFDTMVEEEVNCFISMVKLLHVKLQRLVLVIIGSPNTPLLRCLALADLHEPMAKEGQSQVSSTLIMECHRPLPTPTELQPFKGIKIIEEGNNSFLTVSFAHARYLCRLSTSYRPTRVC